MLWRWSGGTNASPRAEVFWEAATLYRSPPPLKIPARLPLPETRKRLRMWITVIESLHTKLINWLGSTYWSMEKLTSRSIYRIEKAAIQMWRAPRNGHFYLLVQTDLQMWCTVGWEGQKQEPLLKQMFKEFVNIKVIPYIYRWER